MIKTAIISRSSLLTVQGGDTTQVLKTAENLNKLGVKADIFKASDHIDYDNYDLLHFFNIIRPGDHLYHIRKSRKPYLVSTIYLDYSYYDRKGRGKILNLLFRLPGKYFSEYLKNNLRFFKKQDSLVSPEYLLGHRRAMKLVLQKASMILPNSFSEFERLSKDLGYQGNYMVIPNGVDQYIFGKMPENIHREYKVICVAQVYGMKNQHSLIQACQKLQYPLAIIGKTPPNHTKYLQYCRDLSGENIEFYDYMPQEELVKHYAGAKVHALPSWFETTGLSSLEAGALGCNLVVGEGGDTREYFRDRAFYCRPDNQVSIENALERAMHKKADGSLKELILSEYTWEKAARATRIAYKKVLDDQ